METVKLTKQQKRDIVRAKKRKLELENGNDNTINDKTKKNDEKLPRKVDINLNNTKTSIYKRPTVYPDVLPNYKGPTDRFLTYKDDEFDKVLKTSYNGFIIDKPKEFSKEFHKSFRSSFEDLDSNGAFQFDMTQPTGLKTKVAKTFVSRCLVGAPGTTYKYLGLRMFSHPWNAGEVGVTDAMIKIGELNNKLINRTKKLLKDTGKDETGSCEYNLTLINRCFPDGEIKLKDEPLFSKEKCTVSWHADSTLEHYSSIAVYHCTREISTGVNKQKIETIPEINELNPTGCWRVALRLFNNAEGPLSNKFKAAGNDMKSTKNAPPVAVELPDKYSYYLLDDFNHHHQHSVLSGNFDRFASTHRVCRSEGHTYLSIKTKCESVLKDNTTAIKQWKGIQISLSEVEFEWIRQMYIQGETHYKLHSWWQLPIQELLSLWVQLELKSLQMIDILRDAAGGIAELEIKILEMTQKEDIRRARKYLNKRRKRCENIDSNFYDVISDFLLDRHTKRDGWLSREIDPSFRDVPKDCRPIKVPFTTSIQSNSNNNDNNNNSDLLVSSSNNYQILPPDSGRSQRNILEVIKELKELKSKFINNNPSDDITSSPVLIASTLHGDSSNSNKSNNGSNSNINKKKSNKSSSSHNNNINDNSNHPAKKKFKK
jgi:alpha-ketoglutarate-dependent dioxygenase FTO